MNKNRTIIFLSLLFWLSALIPASGQLTLSRSSAPTIDGKIEAKEWQDAVQKELTGSGKVYFKFDGSYVYVGVQGLKPGWAHLYLSDREDGDVTLMHASAALGRLVYRQDKSRLWQTADKYAWSLREPAITDETRRKMSKYLAQNGWLANNNKMGAAGEFEFQFKPSNESFYLAVLFAGEAKNPQFYPKTLTDATLFEELIFGNTPPDLKFVQKQWQKVILEK